MPIPLATVGLISAGLSAAGTAGSIISANNANKQQQEHALNMYHLQRGHSLADWAMQNEYNHPSSQMARLRSAGLNPNLVYGSGQSVQPAATPRAATASAINPRIPDLNTSGIMGGIADATVKQAQVDNLRTQNTVLVQDALLKAADTKKRLAEIKKIGVDTDTSSFDLALKESLRNINIGQAQANLDATKIGTDIKISENERAAALNASNLREAAQRIINMRVQNLEAQSRIETNAVTRQKIQAEIQSIQHAIHNMDKSGKLQQLDIDLKKMGIQPGDEIYWRVLGRALNWLPFGTTNKTLLGIE